ncbi:MAG TPA: CTP synthase, partial [Candidatus Portnoybacteria bacterium]|nr:CTP synthase [Candidatus Portnoybacteria bacterium]
IEAIKHASWFYERKPTIKWIDAEIYEKNPAKLKELKELDGIIVPGGYGHRGVEGKIKAIQFARENKIPFLGLCYGMQLAVIEFARNVCGLKGASSTEIVRHTKYPVIDILPEQKKNLREKKYGATMRLGAYPCRLIKNTRSQKAYGRINISERHRHRFEVNNKYRKGLEKGGLVVAGINPERDLVEIIELKNHPFFTGTQFHPEFKSRPLKPHPLYRGFIKASLTKHLF